MAAPTLRNDIEELKVELLKIRQELIVRFGNIREDSFTGLKVVAALLAAYYGLKVALFFLKLVLGLMLRHKVGVVLLGTFAYFAVQNQKDMAQV